MTLSLSNVSLRLDTKTLLSDVSLQVIPGQVTVLLGPNGAGKSSALKLAVGEAEPHLGSVTLNSAVLSLQPLKQRAKQIALLPQLSLLNFPYTVNEVIALGRTPHSESRQTTSAIIDHCLNQVGIAHLAQQFYPTLSGGEKQLTQLARILAQLHSNTTTNARFLLLDEPTAALDFAHKEQVLRLITQTAKSGYGVLVVLHDFNQAIAIADSVVLLNQGNVVAQGSAEDVITAANVQQVYGASIQTLRHPQTGKPVIISDISNHD